MKKTGYYLAAVSAVLVLAAGLTSCGVLNKAVSQTVGGSGAGGSTAGGSTGDQAGKDAGKDSGKDSGKDAGKDSGKDVGKDSGNSSGKEMETSKGEADRLPAYTPVDPETVPEAPESDFTFEVYNGGSVEITGYQGSATQVKIPENLGGATSIHIKTDVFRKNESITYLYLPKTVTAVEENAFYGCTALEELNMAGSAFVQKGWCRKDTSLRRVVLGEGCLQMYGSLDYGAFQDCTSLMEVVFPSTLLVIPEYSFKGCSQLTTVDLSGTVLTDLGNRAFADCENLEEIRLPATITRLESGAFTNCHAIKSVTFNEGSNYEVEDGIVYEGTTALFYLEGLGRKEVTVRPGTEKLGDHVFQSEDPNLKKIILPDSVTKMRDAVSTFYGNAVVSYQGKEYAGNQITELDAVMDGK